MFSLHKPSFDSIGAFLDRAASMPFTYSAVSATRTTLPEGFDCDRQRVLLGHGRADFETAQQALQTWRMFPEPMVELCWPSASIERGTVVAALFAAGPVWSLNACRIVYSVNEQTADRSTYGFAYGTLPVSVHQHGSGDDVDERDLID